MNARAVAHYDEIAFRNYVADGLKILTENTAMQNEKYRLTMRYSDIIHGKKPEPEKDAQTIINEIRAAIEEA